MFFWSGQRLQDLGERTQPFGLLLVNLACQIKESGKNEGKNEIVIYFYLSLQLGELSEKAEGTESFLAQREARDSGKSPSDLCPASVALNEYFGVFVKEC